LHFLKGNSRPNGGSCHPRSIDHDSWSMSATELPETETEAGAAAEADTGPEARAEAEAESWIPHPAPLAHTVGHSRESSSPDHERNGAA
jgi:hypothetical protein